jgi:hypothetical protein
MNNNHLKTYASTAIVAIALASMLMLVPTLDAQAAKQTSSGVKLKGPAPTITATSTGATSSPFQLTGLGTGPATAELTVTGFFPVECRNPGGNIAPGQSQPAEGTSGEQSVDTSKPGSATVPSLTATVTPPTVSSDACPNPQWTAEVGPFVLQSATITVTFAGDVVFSQTRTF